MPWNCTAARSPLTAAPFVVNTLFKFHSWMSHQYWGISQRSRDALGVHWGSPAFDGGAFVVNYRLEIRPLQPPEQARPSAN